MGLFGDIGAAFSAINPVAALGTIGSIAGPILGYVGQQQTNAQNAAIANAANLTQGQIASMNIQEENEFAQNGIQWRVEDAAKAGLSPLAALGATEPSYSPVQEVMSTPQYQSPLTSLSSSLPQMGQDITRSIAAAQSPDDRALTADKLRTSHANADYAETQAAHAKLELMRMLNPPNPSTPSFMNPPDSDFQWTHDSDGSLVRIPSNSFSQASHGDIGANWSWMINNKLLPAISDMYKNIFTYAPDFRSDDTRTGGLK